MKAKRMILPIALSLLVMSVVVLVTLAQGQSQGPEEGQFKTTIKGKIDYSERFGGYFVVGVEPGGEFMILNQNPKVLEPLKSSQKTVTIEGRLKGPERVTIDKIDGKPYSGKPASK